VFRLYFCLFLLFSITDSYSQERILTTVDSLYDSKNYSELIQQAESYLLQESPNVYGTSKLKYMLANSYYRSGDFATCWDILIDAHSNVQEIDLSDTVNVELYVDIAQRLGDYSFLAEEYQIGISAMAQALKVGKEKIPNDAWRLGKLFHKAGAVYRIMTQFDNSIAHLEEGQTYLPKMPEDRGKYLGTVFLAEMAQVYNDQNQLNKCIEIFKSILKTAQEEDNKKRLSIYNNNIGIAYERKGDYGKCEYHLRKSLEAKFDLFGEKTPKIITSYTNLARINTLLKRYKIADEYYTKLEELIGEVFEKDHTKNGDTQYNIATSYYQQKLYNKALPHCREAVRIWGLHKSEDDLTLSEAQFLLGATYSKLGEYEEAIPILKDALEVRSKGIKTQDSGRKNILIILCEIYLEKGEDELANSYLDQAFKATNYDEAEPFSFEKIENPATLIDPFALKLANISKKISVSSSEELIHQGTKINIVCDSLIQYIKLKYDDVASRRIATSQIQDLNEAMIRFNYEVQKVSGDDKYVTDAFRIIERSNNTFLYEAIAEENSNSEFGVPQQTINRKSSLQDSITLLHNKLESFPIDIRMESKEYATNLSQLNSYKNDLYSIVKDIEVNYPKYFESIYKSPKISFSDIQSSLKEDEVILSYFNGNDKVYGLLIKPKSYQFLSLGNSKKVETATIDFLDILKKRSMSTPYLNSSRDLYNILIAPFDIPDKSSISIIADDILSLLPFEILIDERNNLPMLLSHVITYQYSNSLKQNSSSKKKGKGSIAMAPIFEDKSQSLFAQNFNLDDRFRSDVSYLPETKNEVNSIHALLKGEVYIGTEANESTFKSLAPGKALLHLATHGFVDHENPDFSRLYFNSETDSLQDGLLHAHEIVNMNLSADLVTLSACNTGAGKIQNGEGISSLGRAFAYANCPNQLISLWPANDKSTTQLMTYYYENLKAGLGKSKALTEAKRRYLASAPEIFKHPYYWAGFVYYGQDDPLNLGSKMPLWAWGLICLGILAIILFNRRKIQSLF